jgi:hypothetical protein
MLSWGMAPTSVSRNQHLHHQKYISDNFKKLSRDGVYVINFDDLLCGDLFCQVELGGKFLYSDADHLSIAGAMTILPKLEETWALIKK